MRRVILLMFSLALVLVLSSVASIAQGPKHGDLATHIVVFNESVSAAQLPAAVPEFARAYVIHVTHEYNTALRGFAGVIPQGRLRALQNDPKVAYIEENIEMSIAAQSTPTGVRRIFASSNSNIDIDATDDYRVDVDVAILDTGIYAHPDLNLVGHVTCTSGSCVNGGSDGNGHGTHVAGTVGALDNNIGVVGVAPGARLYGVKVLTDSGSGSNAGVIAGIDWVAANSNVIEVANMSLGGGYSSALNTAVRNAVNSGVAFAVAAGNESTNASTKSPASEASAVTVSALADFNGLAGGGAAATCRSDVDDTFANFSNYGSVVDIIAPGVCINSTWYTGGYNSISGTSMASPHVAGALALLASNNPAPNSRSDVDAMVNTLLANGNFNWNNSDDGDSAKEPLLSVTGFNPTLVATGNGGGGGGGGSTTVSIGDIDSSTQYYWSWYWNVTVTAKAVDGNGNPVSGATISMTANGAINGSGSCTTGTSGTCSLGTGWMSSGSYVTFTMTNVSASGYTYNSGANSDPDGDSNGTSITVYR